RLSARRASPRPSQMEGANSTPHPRSQGHRPWLSLPFLLCDGERWLRARRERPYRTWRLKARRDLPTSRKPSWLVVGEAGDVAGLIGIPRKARVSAGGGLSLGPTPPAYQGLAPRPAELEGTAGLGWARRAVCAQRVMTDTTSVGRAFSRRSY